MRTTAAGGTGNTPPGTGCNPGAVGRKTVWSQSKMARLEVLLQRYYLMQIITALSLLPLLITYCLVSDLKSMSSVQ